jgi:hypothetical protein
MASKYQTTKILKKTRSNAYAIKAITGEGLAALIDRLVGEELNDLSPNLEKSIKESKVKYSVKQN